MEYIRAGADVITTNTFVLTPYHMESIGRTEKLLELLQVRGDQSQVDLLYIKSICQSLSAWWV
jgi:S-methylmethionine-dependent homocysteine/selenocysteine methylase